MEDLIQIVIFLLIIGASLLFGDKKKRQQRRPPPARQRPRRPAPRAPTRRAPELPEPVARSELPPLPQSPAEVSPQEFYDRLKDRVAVEATKRGMVEPDSPLYREAVSLETLEGAGPETHQRFHDLYVDEAQLPPATVEPRRRFRLHITPRSLREAIVMKEVLGPPKGLEA